MLEFPCVVLILILCSFLWEFMGISPFLLYPSILVLVLIVHRHSHQCWANPGFLAGVGLPQLSLVRAHDP